MDWRKAVEIAEQGAKLRRQGCKWSVVQSMLGVTRHTISKYMKIYELGGTVEIKRYVEGVKKKQKQGGGLPSYRKAKKPVKRDTDEGEFKFCGHWQSILYSKRLSFNG